MKILVDTREQKPLFPKAQRKTLNVGDYTTEKLKTKFVIERKSLSDLYGTLTKGNTRFKYELFRAAFHHIQIEVFIEGTHDDFINKRFPKGEDRKFSKEGLERLVKTFERKYYLKFVWCKSRKHCISSVESRLLYIEKLK
ncbi:MAG TPA: ERCC4 domain-containing protein [Patescibacteria group bacterium]|nr:ERCC4 domain-containing protein [Patescibacteria group bacterium]